MDIERALKNIGDWISRETESRKYPKSELLELSESLQVLKAETTRQSATSEDVQEAIEQLMHGVWQSYKDGYPITLEGKTIDLAVTAVQEYRPCTKVSEGLPPENELRNGMVLAWSKQLDEWQVENWGYVKDRPDDYTHWKPLPEPPKGE